MRPHLKKMWVIPPEGSGDFVAHMEDILDVYHMPYDPEVPLVCMDEKPVQLIKETRTSIPACTGEPMREAYEYERNGTANIFMFTEPLQGHRVVNIRQRRTAIDWAHEIRDLLETHYADAKRIRLVCDNLNTHSFGSLYEAFPPEQARSLASRLEIHHTPKHGSWLNIAEIEISALSMQCLDRRIPDIDALRRETKGWEHNRNMRQKGVDWQFTTHDARIKLKRLYPQYHN